MKDRWTRREIFKLGTALVAGSLSLKKPLVAHAGYPEPFCFSKPPEAVETIKYEDVEQFKASFLRHLRSEPNSDLLSALNRLTPSPDRTGLFFNGQRYVDDKSGMWLDVERPDGSIDVLSGEENPHKETIFTVSLRHPSSSYPGARKQPLRIVMSTDEKGRIRKEEYSMFVDNAKGDILMLSTLQPNFNDFLLFSLTENIFRDEPMEWIPFPSKNPQSFRGETFEQDGTRKGYFAQRNGLLQLRVDYPNPEDFI